MKTILLVEDDPFILNIYATCLKKAGFNVDVAKDGKMALEKIKHHHPDLLILDILLPKVDGWEILRTIRNNPTTKNIKAVVVSNVEEKEYAEQIANIEVVKYFLKIATTPQELVDGVKEILK